MFVGFLVTLGDPKDFIHLPPPTWLFFPFKPDSREKSFIHGARYPVVQNSEIGCT